MDDNKCCGTCKFPKGFEFTPTGKFKKGVSAQCSCPVEWPPMPYFLVADLPKKGGWQVKSDCWSNSVWPDDGKDCPCWKAKG